MQHPHEKTGHPTSPIPNDRLADTAEETPSTLPGGLMRYTLPSLAVAGAVGAFALFREKFQDSHLFYPSRYPTGVWDPSVYGLPYEDAWFESEDGTALHGWWIVHPKAKATVVFCHGNTGSIGDRVGLYLQLRRLKVNVFAFDYRGYGRSAGEPNEQGLFQDVRAALDHVHHSRGIPFEKIVLFGHSLGGAVATDGALHRPVAGLVVQSSFTSVREMARVVYPDVPIYLLARDQFQSIEKVPLLTLPKLFIHGTEDGTVPYSMGEQLHAAAAEPKEWLSIARAGHNDVERFGHFRYFRTLTRFFKRCVA